MFSYLFSKLALYVFYQIALMKDSELPSKMVCFFVVNAERAQPIPLSLSTRNCTCHSLPKAFLCLLKPVMLVHGAVRIKASKAPFPPVTLEWVGQPPAPCLSGWDICPESSSAGLSHICLQSSFVYTLYRLPALSWFSPTIRDHLPNKLLDLNLF